MVAVGGVDAGVVVAVGGGGVAVGVVVRGVGAEPEGETTKLSFCKKTLLGQIIRNSSNDDNDDNDDNDNDDDYGNNDAAADGWRCLAICLKNSLTS